MRILFIKYLKKIVLHYFYLIKVINYNPFCLIVNLSITCLFSLL